MSSILIKSLQSLLVINHVIILVVFFFHGDLDDISCKKQTGLRQMTVISSFNILFFFFLFRVHLLYCWLDSSLQHHRATNNLASPAHSIHSIGHRCSLFQIFLFTAKHRLLYIYMLLNVSTLWNNLWLRGQLLQSVCRTWLGLVL